MFGAFLILTGAVFAMWYELPRLLQQNLVREAVAYVVLLIIGVGLCMALALNVNFPNPAELIVTVFRR